MQPVGRGGVGQVGVGGGGRGGGRQVRVTPVGVSVTSPTPPGGGPVSACGEWPVPGRPGVGGTTAGGSGAAAASPRSAVWSDVWPVAACEPGAAPAGCDSPAPAAGASLSETPPSTPPFSLMMYATMAAYSSSLSDSGASSGIVVRMFSSSSPIGSLPHARRKLRPASSGASKSPRRLARWQSAQASRYTASPATACSWVYDATAVVSGAWPATGPGCAVAAAASTGTTRRRGLMYGAKKHLPAKRRLASSRCPRGARDARRLTGRPASAATPGDARHPVRRARRRARSPS